jgi:hypothetical protein
MARETVLLPRSFDHLSGRDLFLRPGAGESQGQALRFDTQTRNPAPLQNLPTVSPDAQRLVKRA